MEYAFVEAPLGRLLLAGDAAGLRLIGFPLGPRRQPQPDPGWRRNDARFAGAAAQLAAYFAGRLTAFDLPLAPHGTAFQRAVWQALRAIPYGETRSYGELARALGRPRAARAVGAANAANPLPIVVPCHRLIGHDGHLTGFGGGLAAKAALLALERGEP